MENFRPAFVCFSISAHILSCTCSTSRASPSGQTLSLWKNKDVVPSVSNSKCKIVTDRVVLLQGLFPNRYESFFLQEPAVSSVFTFPGHLRQWEAWLLYQESGRGRCSLDTLMTQKATHTSVVARSWIITGQLLQRIVFGREAGYESQLISV